MRFSPAEQVVLQEVEEAVILLDVANNQFYSLNPTGLILWRALTDGAQSIDDLVAVIVDEFVIDEATALRDVSALLDELVGSGLVDAT